MFSEKNDKHHCKTYQILRFIQNLENYNIYHYLFIYYNLLVNVFTYLIINYEYYNTKMYKLLLTILINNGEKEL